jgi:hypothetical protein
LLLPCLVVRSVADTVPKCYALNVAYSGTVSRTGLPRDLCLSELLYLGNSQTRKNKPLLKETAHTNNAQ